MKTLSIAGREVGPGCPCFVIAEAGVNHNGRLDLALQLVGAAAEAGADAVKFQTFKAARLATAAAPKAAYQADGTAESQLEMLTRLELREEWHAPLMERARRAGILFLSTPFDEASADFLESLDLPAFKVSSGELVNLPFLEHLAAKGRPLVVSTGMASLADVEAAVRAVRGAGDPPLALLHCVSCYPADPASVNLRAMDTLARAFALPVGYSDHTLGMEVPLAAVALGACIVEKHLTLDASLPGPDHRASAEPAELARLVRGIRAVESALGDGRKLPAAEEAEIAAVARKSLVAARDLAAGEVLTRETLAVRRPGTGLPPAMVSFLLGRTLRRSVPSGTPLSLELLR